MGTIVHHCALVGAEVKIRQRFAEASKATGDVAAVTPVIEGCSGLGRRECPVHEVGPLLKHQERCDYIRKATRK